MKFTPAIERLAKLGDDSWAVYKSARAKAEQGEDIIELTIGEPDIPTPDYLIDVAIESLRNGRTDYSPGAGELNLRQALALRYSKMTKREIGVEQVLCFPGTQTALYAVMQAIAGEGDEVIVGDPMYATYDAVIASSCARQVAVPLKPEDGFRLQAQQVESLVSENTTTLFLNSPHNPTGAVLRPDQVHALGELAIKHDLWILCDEVYDELLFDASAFCSPLNFPEFAERTLVVSSISKSHAAPGFRSGWCIGPAEFCEKMLPYSEAMLFGGQPFLADATAIAISKPSPVAESMKKRFAARAQLLAERVTQETTLSVHQPEAGMFALLNVSSLNMNGKDYAWHLLDHAKVGVMPGASFGAGLQDWVRVCLTESDERFAAGVERIIKHANSIA